MTRDGLSPIIEAGDDGEILDASRDGEITCIETDDGELVVEFDPDGELAERIEWMAGHRGEEPEEFVEKAIRESLSGERE